MLIAIEITPRLAWLSAALAEHRDRIAVLLRHMTGLGTREAMNPSVFKKFLNMLDQVATAREQEIRILNTIEAVEQKHRFRRVHHQLPLTQTRSRSDIPVFTGPEAPCPRDGLLWTVAFLYLFMRTAINQKKQGLTAD